ncbi:MAG: hypothetical protein ACOC3V_01630 [bacterium]
MNKKAQFNLGIIILLAVGILFCMAIFEQVVDTQSELTDLKNVNDETTNLTTETCYTTNGWVNESDPDCNITVDNWYPSGDWRKGESSCYLSGVTVSNATDDDLTLSTDYRIDSDAGIIVMLNTSSTSKTNLGENVLVDYSYCGEGYNKDSSSRSIAGLISLFTALAILGFAIIGIRNWLQ